jgi:16S rRNA processing protein RimM
MPENPLMPIGQVAGAHGLDGAVKVHFYDAGHRTISAGQTLKMMSPRDTQTDYSVEWVRPHKRNFLVGLKGVNDRNQAQALSGSRIVINRSDLPALRDDTFYWVDLIGMDVYTLTDRYLGQIKAIIPTGSNDVYVVSHKAAETLVPALKTVIMDVNREANTMRVELPEGL